MFIDNFTPTLSQAFAQSEACSPVKRGENNSYAEDC